MARDQQPQVRLESRNADPCHLFQQQTRQPLSPNQVRQATSCAKSFTKHIHCRRPAASVSKTSTAACRSKFGTRHQYKLTQSKKHIAKVDLAKRRSKSTQPRKTSGSKPSIHTTTRPSAVARAVTTTRRQSSIH